MKTVSIPGNCFLALLDRELRKKGLEPVYVWTFYIDTQQRKKQEGLLFHSIQGHTVPFPGLFHPHTGILGFVNGKEPGDGTLPLHEIFPQKGDTIAVAYVVEGMYTGNFDKHWDKEEQDIHGFKLIHSIHVGEDFHAKSYEISVLEHHTLLSQR